MRRPLNRHLASLALLGAVALAACESAEERAQSHYERAAALLEDGETERAALEFRNALQADPKHVPTLRAFAAMLLEQGDLSGAAREYTRLAAIKPDDAFVHLALADLALRMQDFPAVETYAERAYALAPENVQARAMRATVAFRQGEEEEALDLARGVLEEVPHSVAAHMVLIADRLGDQDFEGALAQADAALEHAPAESDLHLARLAALEQIGNPDAVRGQLETMSELFPENGMILQALMQWYISNGRSDDAIGVMREIADRTPDDPTAQLNVVQTILSTKGAVAARTELETLVSSEADPSPFQVALARLDFAEGRQDAAIAALEALVRGKESSPVVRDVQVALATMLDATGRDQKAQRLSEAVLAADARNVGALKMRARWRIEEDRTEEALADLRAASMEAPRDPEVMTLMAAAHEREGAVELVGERLARAVEASAFGVEESLRYALYLIREERFAQAEGVIVDGLRRDPNNPRLLVALGQVHLGRDDTARARQVAGLLRGLGTPEAADAGVELELAALSAEGRVAESVTLLEGLADDDRDNMQARGSLAQALLASGDVEGARAVIDEILAEDETSVPGRLMLAALLVQQGNPTEAEPIYRAVIDQVPQSAEPYQLLFRLLDGLDRKEEAVVVLETGIESTGRSSALLNLRAGQYYSDGEHNAAIAFYEEIYARDTSNVVIANNLASLLSMHREDPASLERAFVVARRFRGTDVPHFQDTYGWILVLRGDHEQALTYLEPAAAALPEDAVVHFHLGMAYYALERWEEAKTALSRAVELGGSRPDLPDIATARDRLGQIEARPPEPTVDG